MSGGRTKRVMFLLAPAKTLDFSRVHKDIKTLPATTPRLLNKGTQDLLAILKKQSISDLVSEREREKKSPRSSRPSPLGLSRSIASPDTLALAVSRRRRR